MLLELGKSFTVPLPNLFPGSNMLHMLWIEPGSFLMGSPKGEPWRDEYYDQEPFRVRIQHGYWLGKYPVTQAQWQAVMSNNPSYYEHSCFDCPIENIDWHLAIAFCEVLNNNLIEHLPKGYFFSLPTEAQWEYACRAGTHTPFYNGHSEEALEQVAWYSANSAGHPHPVGKKAANLWGLHDMLGNISEWCYDETDYYPRSDTIDWIAKGDHYTTLRMVRGGGYRSTLESGSLRCSARIETFARASRPFVGIRLCLRLIYSDTLYR